MIKVNQEILTEDIREFILNGFSEHSISKLGYNGFVKEQIAFTAKENNKLIGAIIVSPYYGALWIKLFFVDKNYRGNRIGKQLLEKALNHGKEQKLKFAFVETLSFQALEYYKNFGFVLEFTREGYQNEIAFHYLRKYL